MRISDWSSYVCSSDRDPAGQGQPGHAGLRDETPGRRKAMRLTGLVDIPPQGATFNDSNARLGSHRDAAHKRQVDNHTIVADCGAQHGSAETGERGGKAGSIPVVACTFIKNKTYMT